MPTVRELVTQLSYAVDKSALNQYVQMAQDAANKVAGKMQAAATTAADFGKGFAEGAKQGAQEALAAAKPLTDEQEKGAKAVKQQADSYSQIGSMMRRLIAGFSVIATARIADQWASVEARVGMVTDNVEQQRQVLADIYSIAQDTRQEYTGTADLYQKIRVSAKDTNLSMDDTVTLTRTISQALALGGGSAEESARAIVQFGQAMSKGVLRGQDLNSVMEQAPGLAQALATGFGVSVGKLKELAEQGTLTAKDIQLNLLKQSKAVQAQFDKMPRTFGGAMTKLKNALGRIINDLNKSSRAAVLFSKAVDLVINNLEKILAIIALIGAQFAWISLMTKIRTLSMAALWPYLRMAAIMATIYLIGQDIYTWLKGGRSMTGAIIGRVEEWQAKIDQVLATITKIKDTLGGTGEALGPWVVKWGTIATLVLGVGAILFKVASVIFSIGQFLWPIFTFVVQVIGYIVTALAAILGWPAWLVAAVIVAIAAIGLLVYRFWDDIKAFGIAAWDAIKNAASKAWDWIKDAGSRALDWLLDKARELGSAVIPDWLKAGVAWAGGKLGFGPGAGAMQRGPSAGGGGATVTNNLGGVTVNAPNANPASVAAATQKGVGAALLRSREAALVPGVEAAA